jgi:hypothetical protein
MRREWQFAIFLTLLGAITFAIVIGCVQVCADVC